MTVTPRRYDVREQLRGDWLLLLLLAVGLVVGMVVAPNLSGPVPIHWNARGEPDGFLAPPWGAVIHPLVGAAVYLGLLVLPLIDPSRANYPLFAGTVRAIRWVLVLTALGLHAVGLLVALGHRLDSGRAVIGAVGLLFLILGNVLGRVRHNWFIGIRTPWTLASEAVWQRTHRLAAPIWVLGGAVGILSAALLPPRPRAAVFGAAVAVMVVVPVVYSYLEWRRTGAGESS
ncbi:SdpI family protein [Caldinitratiruptor microaerophilus]|uniref:DUF1648 domain-containing protein n=1 Tax=Caldinitratiruptor microaerophilus TaxID=671077 RepID=A0AA35G594_9FIRM|nr:SdpI family protein [Caldinitratiruptor microaerophilus]BDG58966.1 hypothetical protein caldi_00560 [Caldinitratiruptor microaerophilus]